MALHVESRRESGRIPRDPMVHICIYPFGSKHPGSGIACDFGSERDIDDWIQSFKEELDEVAEDAKRALRASRTTKAFS